MADRICARTEALSQVAPEGRRGDIVAALRGMLADIEMIKRRSK